MNEELLLKDEVYAVIGAAIEVHREFGSGFLEGAYQEAMEIELTMRGIPFEPLKELHIRYKGHVLKKRYCADFLCYDRLIVEIKAEDHQTGRDEAQLINYLKATGLQVGLLINFGHHGKLEWKRMVLTRHGPIDPDDLVK